MPIMARDLSQAKLWEPSTPPLRNRQVQREVNRWPFRRHGPRRAVRGHSDGAVLVRVVHGRTHVHHPLKD